MVTTQQDTCMLKNLEEGYDHHSTALERKVIPRIIYNHIITNRNYFEISDLWQK